MIKSNIQRKRRRKKYLFPKIALLSLVLFILYSFLPFGSATQENPPNRTFSTIGQSSNDQYPILSENPPSNLANFPAFSLPLPVTELTDTRYLELVNRTFSMQDPTPSYRLVLAWPDMAVRATDILLHETAFSAIHALYQAAGRAGITNLFIASGYRSMDEQRELYENATNRSYVMPAGHSEHQLGLAADILASGRYHTGGMRGSTEARWLAENAAEFGLILRYPSHKQDITEVAYEPWHFRYVGRIHAFVMGQHDFVLEEYIQFLQEIDGYQTTFESKTYYILYQRAENGILWVPEHLEFNLSRTNTGGYIITAWR